MCIEDQKKWGQDRAYTVGLAGEEWSRLISRQSVGFPKGEEWEIRQLGQALRTLPGSSVRAGRPQGESGPSGGRSLCTSPHFVGRDRGKGNGFPILPERGRKLGRPHRGP